MRLMCIPVMNESQTSCQQIWREERLAGFYKGCLTNLVRTTPAAALTFTSFELLAREMRALGARHRAADAAS